MRGKCICLSMKTKKRIGTANAVFHFDSRKEGICEATPFGNLYKNALKLAGVRVSRVPLNFRQRPQRIILAGAHLSRVPLNFKQRPQRIILAGAPLSHVPLNFTQRQYRKFHVIVSPLPYSHWYCLFVRLQYTFAYF